MKQNLHTHTTYCDGNNSIPEMIRSAIEKDFDVLGFSGHSFTSFDKSYCMSEEGTKEYIDSVLAAKHFFEKDPELAANFYAYMTEYKKPLRLFLGIEQDLYADEPALRCPKGLFNPGYKDGVFDYVIGSTHAFFLSWADIEEMNGKLHDFRDPMIEGVEFDFEGVYLYVDNKPEAIGWAIEKVFRGDAMAFAERYFLDEGRIVDDTDCDFVGHFDLLLKYNETKHYFDETSLRYKKARDMALERIFGSFRAKGRRPLFEVNTGAMAKGYRTVPYPSADTLRMIKEMGGQLIINSDCHKAEKLDHGFAEAKTAIEKAGFRKADTESFSDMLVPLDIYI